MKSKDNWGHKIDKEGGVPLYRQLEEILKERVRNGDFKPGDRIPTELELCEEFGISRTSVRQALADLANDGFLCRHQGRGTFVNSVASSKVKLLRAMIAEDQWIPPLEEAVSMYNEEAHDEEIHMEIQAVGRPQLRSKILSAVGRGDAPDFALIDWAWGAEFADLHFLKRLDRLDPQWAEEFKADLFPAFVDKMTPTLYGLQPETSASLIWYRKDWFSKEGIRPPRNWEELRDIAHHFSNRDRYPLAFAGGTSAGETTTYQLLPFVWSAGGALFSGGEVSLDEKAVRAVRFLVDLVHEYKVASPDVVSFEWDQPAKLFASGEAVLAVGGSYEKALIQGVSGWDESAFREKAGCFPVPVGPGGVSATTAGGMVYVVFRQSKNATLALEILKRVVSPPLVQEFCTRTGRSPTRVSVARALDTEESWFSCRVSDLLQKARLRPDIPQYAKVSEQFQLMMENAISRRMDPKDAVAKAREIIAAIIS